MEKEGNRDGFQPMISAPRDGTWIELFYRSGSYTARNRARSSGPGDAPGIWRFDNMGCLRFEDEDDGWSWRALSPREAAAAQAYLDRKRDYLTRPGFHPDRKDYLNDIHASAQR